MSTYRTVDFWAPALHANTLLQLAVPEPGPSRDPVVRALPIKHGEHEAVGVIKRMVKTDEGLLVADDAFRMSALTLPAVDDPTAVPVVTSQSEHKVPTRGTSLWTGLVNVGGGAAVSSLSTGRLTLYRGSAEAQGTRKVGAPVLTLSSPENGGLFALGGKEVEMSVWDTERTFAGKDAAADGKRKKDALAPGQVWQAKNVPHNSLQLRQPVHHLCSAFLPGSSSDIVSGTKSGSIRRYDTRQRKPVGDWKVAREGGIGCIAPGAEHELFYADHSNLTGVLDLRTGKMLYSIPGLAATAHYLYPLHGAEFDLPGQQVAGLTSISSDATLRICATTPPPAVMPKGNWVTGAKKAGVIGSVGGVGVGTFIFAGYGTGVDKPEPKEGAEDGEEESDEEVGEEIWEGMSEAEDRSDNEDMDEEDEEDEDSSDDEAPAKKQRRRK